MVVVVVGKVEVVEEEKMEVVMEEKERRGPAEEKVLTKATRML